MNENVSESKYLFWENVQAVEDVKKVLQKNNVVLSSTDTVCGLLADVSEKSFKTLHEIKSDRGSKPYLILIDTVRKLDHFVDTKLLTKKMLNVIKNCWPGPLTIIFNAKKTVPEFLQSETNTIALRCPKHDGLQNILQHFDGLFSTSANKSGQKPPSNVSEVEKDVLDSVACVITDKLEQQESLPSSIIDFSSVDSSSHGGHQEEKIKIAREGAFSREELEKYYE
jgi:L-threonylcarbamoyladenylate synthase